MGGNAVAPAEGRGRSSAVGGNAGALPRGRGKAEEEGANGRVSAPEAMAGAGRDAFPPEK